MTHYDRLFPKIISLPIMALFFGFFFVSVTFAEQSLTVEDVIRLKETGVSDKVILELIRSQSESTETGSVPPRIPPETMMPTANWQEQSQVIKSASDLPFVCPYTPGEHLASWAVGALAGDLGRHFGSKAGSQIGSQFGLTGLIVGSILGGAVGEGFAKSLADDMLRASHLPPFPGGREVFRHLADSHIEHPSVGNAVKALVEVHRLDQMAVRSISEPLYQKAFK